MADKSDVVQIELAPNVSYDPDSSYEYSDSTVLDQAAGKIDPELEVNLKLFNDGKVRECKRPPPELVTLILVQTILVPQPSDDRDDPLNWSWGTKHLILLTVSTSAFLADFQAGAGTPCVTLQSKEWGIDANHINFTGNLNILMVYVAFATFIPSCSHAE